MKRVFAGILSVLLVGVWLCACAPSNNKNQPEPITVGTKLLTDFNVQASETQGALPLAEHLAKNEVLPFESVVTEVLPGTLAGFGNAEITGFKSGASFAPMIGTIPFIGYVFELESDVQPEAFMQTLKDNADLRWNICVEAEEMVAGSAGDKVLFVMCPKQFEE